MTPLTSKSNLQMNDGFLPEEEYEEKPYAEEDDSNTENILTIAVIVLTVIVVIFILLFLYRKLCKKNPLQSHLNNATSSGPGGNIYTSDLNPSRFYPPSYPNPVFRSSFEHSHPTDYHYVAAQQTLHAVRREREPYRVSTERNESILGHATDNLQVMLPRDDLDSGLPLSIQALGSALVTSSPSDNSAASSLGNVNQYMFEQYEASVRELFVPTERSIKKTVSNKLIVVVAHVVDHLGDHLILDNMGISLLVPPGAIREGEKHVITLVLDWDLSDNPDMDSHQALVSPVVYCGPHGLNLLKPCTLAYRHCAYDAGDIQIMVSETELTHQKQWTTLCDAREEMGKCTVTQEECQVQLDHFSLLTSIQSRPSSSHGKKWIQIAVFTCPLQSNIDHYQVRVYFLNKTPCALEWAIQNEAYFGGSKCCPEKVFLFRGNGEDMCLSMAYLSEKWTCIDGCEAERVPFLSIWHGHCPHVAMCFKRSNTSSSRAEEINIHFLAYQDGHENESERLVIHMTEDRSNRRQGRKSCCNNPSHGLRSVRITLPDPNPLVASSSTVEITRGSPNGGSVDVAISSPQQKFDLDMVKDSLSAREIFPEELKRQLIILLDPTAPLGNDWRALASKLSLDQVINFLESIKTSPTMVLLQHMEQKGRCLGSLLQILKDIGRLDAANHVLQLMGREGEEHHHLTQPKQAEYSGRVT